MSTNSELKARLARLGPVRDADPPPSFSGALVPVVLKLDGALDKPIDVANRLRAAGLTLRAAHAIINRLAETRLAVCQIAEGADILALAADLARMNVHMHRRRRLDPGLVTQVRARHGLSQREFAAVIGVDTDTLQNWEQQRNRPDDAALSLVLAFDAAPDVIERALFEQVA
ncbi:MAG TPA: helix-turn-helix domain-containing protein [Acetobacteraceae bacterium]|nr:helix-turn-helix domain-containing protein [Acetobacteraceae bacterium]